MREGGREGGRDGGREGGGINTCTRLVHVCTCTCTCTTAFINKNRRHIFAEISIYLRKRREIERSVGPSRESHARRGQMEVVSPLRGKSGHTLHCSTI